MLIFLGAFSFGVWITKLKSRKVESKEGLEFLNNNTSLSSVASMV
jgi:hypothetical protein